MTASDARLAEIQARVDAATPGPWVWRGDGPSLETVEQLEPYPDGSQSPVSTILYGPWTNDNSNCVDVEPADAEFIAHARDDIPYLLAQLSAARADGWDEGYEASFLNLHKALVVHPAPGAPNYRTEPIPNPYRSQEQK